jgi:hypothetical protein
MRTLLRHGRQIVEHHVLVASPQLRMDMQVVGLAIRNLILYSARPEFDLTMDAATGSQLRECA